MRYDSVQNAEFHLFCSENRNFWMKYRKVMDKRMVLDSIMRLCLKENDRSIDMYIADRKGNTYPITHVFLGESGVLYATNGTALVALEELDDNTLNDILCFLG